MPDPLLGKQLHDTMVALILGYERRQIRLLGKQLYDAMVALILGHERCQIYY